MEGQGGLVFPSGASAGLSTTDRTNEALISDIAASLTFACSHIDRAGVSWYAEEAIRKEDATVICYSFKLKWEAEKNRLTGVDAYVPYKKETRDQLGCGG